MNLKPAPGKPGLWVNPEWKEGTPGTFSVIIGVSKYDYLDGTHASFDLGQLSVSAQTAYKFFCWLRDDYRFRKCPLAQCFLLLSPTQEELKVDPGMAHNLASPSFDSCDSAIGSWFEAMNQLGKDAPQAAQESRSIFVFSGHGLEIVEDQQILLPSDFLRPPVRPVNRAISTQNLSRGLKAPQISHHFFFIDACRAEHDNLGHGQSLTGTEVLNVPSTKNTYRKAFVPILLASAAGEQAWQPVAVSKGPSLFGRALLEGLRAKPDFQPDCSSGTCMVPLGSLTPFVDRRVKEILRDEYNAAYTQEVRLRGDGAAPSPVTEVTFVPPPPAPKGSKGSKGPVSYDVLGTSFAMPSSISPRRPKDYGEAHTILGSEFLSQLWLDKVRVYDLDKLSWLKKGKDYVIHDVVRANGDRSYRIELSIPSSCRNHWLALDDDRRTFGIVLPGDKNAPPRYLLDFDRDRPPGGNQAYLSRLTVRLSPRNGGEVGEAGELWERYDRAGPLEATKEDHFNLFQQGDWSNAPFLNDGDISEPHLRQLESYVEDKLKSPLTALVAGTVLLRARKWNRLHNWLKNLGHWFENIPDGPILWSEQLLQQEGVSEDDDRILDGLITLRTRGLPFTADAFSYALRQAKDALRMEKLLPLKRKQIEGISKRLEAAAQLFRPGGLFCVFAGEKKRVKPGLLEGG